MLLLSLFWLLLFTDALCHDMGSRDCCPLVWRDIGHLDYVPRNNTVIIGQMKGYNRYFTRINLPAIGATRVGIRSDDGGHWFAEPNTAYSYRYEVYTFVRNGCVKVFGEDYCHPGKSKGATAAVLTNPFNCDLSWATKSGRYDMPPTDRRRNNFVKYSTSFLARNEVDSRNIKGGIILSLDDKDQDNRRAFITPDQGNVDRTLDSGPEFLFTDCFKSIPRLITAELVDFTFNRTSVVKNNEKVLQTQTIVNEGNVSQTSHISFSHKIVESLTLRADVSFISSANIRVKVPPSNSVTAPFVGLFKVEGFNTQVVQALQTFAKTGKVEVTSKEASASSEQTVTVPARTVVIARLVTTSDRRTTPFKSFYRFKSDLPDSTGFDVKAALTRLDFTDPNNIIKRDGFIDVLNVGQMTFESGFDTRIEIQTISLDEPSV